MNELSVLGYDAWSCARLFVHGPFDKKSGEKEKKTDWAANMLCGMFIKNNGGTAMNVPQQERIRMKPQEYLEFERTSETRHEYFDGEIFAMTGGSLNHNQINGNIFNLLKNKLKGSACRPFASDMRVKVQKIDKYTYSDIVVVCGDIGLEKNKGVETLLNPIIIVEILSNSTETYDRGTKFRHYRLISSLQEYILVSQDRCLVEQYVRGDGGIWQILNPCTDKDQSISMESINCELLLSDIYDLIEFETDSYSDTGRHSTPPAESLTK